MKQAAYDPGLLDVFRLFVGVRFLFSTLPLLIQRYFGNFRLSRLEADPIWGLVEAAFLLMYLSWPWLQRKLGKFYMPLALAVATLAPLLENYIAIDLHLTDEITQVRFVAGQWQLAIFLLLPLILISWLYSYRVVVGYSLVLALMDGFLLVPSVLHGGGGGVVILSSITAIRTMIYLLVGYAITRLVGDQRQQNTRLAEANRQLSSYTVTLEQLTISRERNRMARELHDTLAHTLSAVSVQLEAVSALWGNDPEKAHNMLSDSQKLTRDGLNEARRAIQALRATSLDDMGLALALKNLARREAERGGLNLDLQVPDEVSGLKPDVEHGVFRIAEEAIRNVVQHAQAKNLSVIMSQRGADLNLMIRDDGHGIKNGHQPREDHYGLDVMRERAEAIGAKLNVESKQDAGTTIMLLYEGENDSRINLR